VPEYFEGDYTLHICVIVFFCCEKTNPSLAQHEGWPVFFSESCKLDTQLKMRVALSLAVQD